MSTKLYMYKHCMCPSDWLMLTKEAVKLAGHETQLHQTKTRRETLKILIMKYAIPTGSMPVYQITFHIITQQNWLRIC